jgi:hypothetical protein
LKDRRLELAWFIEDYIVPTPLKGTLQRTQSTAGRKTGIQEQ